jgi:hypothetical protein
VLVLLEGAAAVEPVALWSAVPVVLVALPVEGAALVELALELELMEPGAEVLLAELDGAAAALWSAVLAGAAEVLAEDALCSLLVVDAVEDWQDSEIIFTLSTLKLLSASSVPVSCTVFPLFALRSLVLPLSL